MRRFICFKNCYPHLLTADLFVYDVKQRKVYPITEIWRETNVWFDPNQRLVLCKFEQRSVYEMRLVLEDGAENHWTLVRTMTFN